MQLRGPIQCILAELKPGRQLAAAAVCSPAIQNGHKLEELFTILPMHNNYTGWNKVIRYLKETKENLIEDWKCSIILLQSVAFLDNINVFGDWFTIEPWVLFEEV